MFRQEEEEPGWGRELESDDWTETRSLLPLQWGHGTRTARERTT